jgi:hypothetical protein
MVVVGGGSLYQIKTQFHILHMSLVVSREGKSTIKMIYSCSSQKCSQARDLSIQKSCFRMITMIHYTSHFAKSSHFASSLFKKSTVRCCDHDHDDTARIVTGSRLQLVNVKSPCPFSVTGAVRWIHRPFVPY